MDDFLRAKFSLLSNDEVMNHSAQQAELGKRLTELKVEFEAPDVECLGIKAAKYDIE